MTDDGRMMPAEVAARTRDGALALRRGDLAAARNLLWPLREAAPGMVPPWLLIAQVAQAGGDDRTAEAALASLLQVETRNLPALLALARIKARQGDDRAAQSLYRTALGVATRPGATVPADLVSQLRGGEAFLTQVERRFAAHLEAAVSDLGVGAGPAGTRLRQSLDLLLGRSELYLQQPSMFYFPGLVQRGFFEREEFAWLWALESAIPVMRQELQNVIAAEGFAPYVQMVPGRAAPANPLLDDPSWSAFHLWRAGEIVSENAARCPATMAALEQAPIPVIRGRSPMAIFSRLEPGTHIRPHHGLLNTRLICHVPLLAPEGCALRVGAETREWREGEALIFDDSFEHEAWNRGTRTRVVLLFEIWRPDISPDERVALTRIFETIDTYQGAAIDSG